MCWSIMDTLCGLWSCVTITGWLWFLLTVPQNKLFTVGISWHYNIMKDSVNGHNARHWWSQYVCLARDDNNYIIHTSSYQPTGCMLKQNLGCRHLLSPTEKQTINNYQRQKVISKESSFVIRVYFPPHWQCRCQTFCTNVHRCVVYSQAPAKVLPHRMKWNSFSWVNLTSQSFSDQQL